MDFIHLGFVYQYALDCSNVPNTPETYEESAALSGQDWALIDIDEHLNELNTFIIPGDHTSSVISDCVSEHDQAAGKVWVLTGEEPLTGILNPLMAPIQLGKSSFDVQQITLEWGIGMSL